MYGAVFRFDGQASVFDARVGPCYRCLFPEPPPPGSVPSCSDAGVFGVLPGTIGTIQATETIKLILGIGSSLVGRLLLYDALEMTFEYVNLRKNPKCKICGPNPEVTTLIDYNEFCGVPGIGHEDNSAGADRDMTALQLATRLQRGDRLRLVDVREPHELAISHLEGAVNLPIGSLARHLSELDSAEEIVVFCKTGNRSARALELLRSAGFRKVWNLRGGINSWARDVDPKMPVY